MSPEQRFSPRKMTMQSDIWSFGMTVWQLLCDNIPYRDYSPEEIEEAIRTDDERPGRPEEMSNDNERLLDLITWCWRVDAKERPKASEVVGYLELHYAERLDVSITGKSVSMVMEPDSVERLSDEKLEHCSVIPLVTLSEWKIDSLEVKLVKRVDSEGFEVMWVGEYAKQQVMIKSRYQDMDAFTKEVSIMAMMKSPHVIALIGVNWTDKSDMKIIMEYMDEGDLQTYLQEHSADDYRWSDKIKHILGIALGLEHIHALGIVHGDFKSRNVLLDFLEGAQLTNFGMAHGVNELNV
ncbi:hypothetical protein AeMF1_014575 [Aphanomyces euteiches]|nr:hypothetical protein AeMF1_014575 [Aphanomyces euteiches]KAH9183935.1 hypothetical protein AeNC1_014091 [Aphanomyces euteiches]